MATRYGLRILGSIVLMSAAVGATTITVAKPYPQQAIRMIVPYAAGGSTDHVARLVAARMSESLGQSIVIENRGGAGGKIGIDAVAKASPDGYTLLFTESGSMIVNAWLFDRKGSNPVADFESIGRITEMQNVLVSHPSAKINDLKDLIGAAQSEPPSYGSSGTGTLGHLAMEMLKKNLNIDLVHIPYKGGAPVTNDLLGGQIPIAALTLPTAAPHVKSGKLIAVAALSEKRTSALPNLATSQEQGYAPISAGLWQGLYAPAGTPRPILELLNQELNKVATDREVRNQLITAGNEITGDLTVDETAELVAQEYKKWGTQLRDLGLASQQ